MVVDSHHQMPPALAHGSVMCFIEAPGQQAETSKVGVDWLPDHGLWFADVEFVKGEKNTLPF